LAAASAPDGDLAPSSNLSKLFGGDVIAARRATRSQQNIADEQTLLLGPAHGLANR
jgi:hypothetical protein